MQSRILVFALLAAMLGTSPAHADGLTAAEFLLMQDKDDDAREALTTWLASERPALDYDGLLDAAQMARHLQDIDLLRRVRTVGEKIEEQFPENSVLRLALGYAYLGLAEENLRLQTGSRSISLYFADAEARGKPVGDEQALLGAQARYAQGDLAGALALLRARREKHREQHGAERTLGDTAFELVQGLYEYEYAAALPVADQGRPSADAQRAFATAVRYLTWALDPEGDPLFPRQRRQALLRRAYSHHRTGHVELAEADYVAAYAEGKKSGPLVLRGLASLYMHRTKDFPAALDRLAARGHEGPRLAEARVGAHLAVGQHDAALGIAEAWLEGQPLAPGAWLAVGRALQALGRMDDAHRCHVRALQIDPASPPAVRAIEGMARRLAAESFDHCAKLYQDLLGLRPADPYVRNNYGFLLREFVSPHTNLLEGGIQKLKPDAPPIALARLRECVRIYAQAAALIDPAQDGNREELAAWNLAGIVNDYGLILHYFEDVQDPELAEKQYLRAMKMTDWTFKDTYSPNLHRLYRHVLKDRLLTWYRAAREARTAILREARGADGGLTLVPDLRKRAAAQRDLEALRARILRELKADAEGDGIPWPPGKEDENGR